MKPSRIALGWLLAAAITPEALAQVTYEQSGGVTYQVTRSPKSIPVTEMRTEQHKTFVPSVEFLLEQRLNLSLC